MLPSRFLPQTDHMTRMALVAAEWALADAGIDPEELPEYDMGVVTASSSGGVRTGRAGEAVEPGQPVRVRVPVLRLVLRRQQRSDIHPQRAQGPGGVIVSDEAGGLDAVAHGRRLIRKGTPMIVSRASTASICPWGWVAQMAGDRLSTSDEPTRAYLPFDADAASVPGEGGAILIMESAESACARGAKIYGEIALRIDVRPAARQRPRARPAQGDRTRPRRTRAPPPRTSTWSSRTRRACRSWTVSRPTRSRRSSGSGVSRSPRPRR